MRRYTFILLLGIVQLFLWNCTKENGSDGNFSQQEMRIVPSVLQTRAGMEDVADIKAFMIDVKSSANSKYDYYAAVKPNGIKWASYNVAADGTVGDALQMLWADATSPVTASALYLADNILPSDKFGSAVISVVADQSTEEGLKKADNLYMSPMEFYPTNYNGEVNVAFNHLMAKLNITLTLGTEFNMNPGTEKNPITNVSIVGISSKRVFNIVDDFWNDATGNAATEVKPYCNSYLAGSGISTGALAKYEAILIPERIQAGTFGLSITVNGKTYTWTSQEEISFLSKFSYNIPVTVGKDYVTVGNIQIADWNTGAELAEGGTDIEDVDVWDGVSVATSLTEGTGTKEDPYVITTGAQLAYIANESNLNGFSFRGKYFILNNDIDLGGNMWTPIGKSHFPYSFPFAGLFDGNGHTIYNLKTSGTGTDDMGNPIDYAFFGSINGSGNEYSVRNLNIKDAYIKSVGLGAILVANASNCLISNCHVSGMVIDEQSGDNATGGLIAWASYATVSGSTAEVELNGSPVTGGFVGQSSYSTFENCSAKGDILGKWSVGGFAGEFSLSSIARDCSTSVNVTANDWNVGGFVGYFGDFDGAPGVSYITGCTASGRVYQELNFYNSSIGGFIGRVRNGHVKDCKFTGELDTSGSPENDYKGAFIGYDILGGKTVRCSYRKAEGTQQLNPVGVIEDETTSSHDITAE